MLSFGLTTTSVGSWTCRKDGMLVLTQIFALYAPTTDAINHPTTVPAPPPVDLFLFQHIRTTRLFSVTDANTLTRIQSRTRAYDASQDPTDPTGGVLGPLRTGGEVVYKDLWHLTRISLLRKGACFFGQGAACPSVCLTPRSHGEKDDATQATPPPEPE